MCLSGLLQKYLGDWNQEAGERLGRKPAAGPNLLNSAITSGGRMPMHFDELLGEIDQPEFGG